MAIEITSTENVMAEKPAQVTKDNASTQKVEDTKVSDAKAADDALEAKAHKGLENKSEDLDDAEDDDLDTQAAGQDDKTLPKKKSGAQRKREKIERLEREVQFLNEKLQKNEPSPKVDETAKQAAASDESKPRPDQFEYHSDYVEALTDWKLEQKLQARDTKERELKLKAEVDMVKSAHTKRLEAFAEKTKDFKDAMDDLVEDMRGVNIPLALDQAVVESEIGPELLYEFAKNKDEFVRICNLPYKQMIKEIVKMELRLSKSSEEKTTTETKTTKAPKPISPVSTGSSGAGKKTIFDPDIPQSEYEAQRREQQKNRSSWG